MTLEETRWQVADIRALAPQFWMQVPQKGPTPESGQTRGGGTRAAGQRPQNRSRQKTDLPLFKSPKLCRWYFRDYNGNRVLVRVRCIDVICYLLAWTYPYMFSHKTSICTNKSLLYIIRPLQSSNRGSLSKWKRVVLPKDTLQVPILYCRGLQLPPKKNKSKLYTT